MEEKKIVETLFVRRSVNVSEQDIDDILCTAFEGGITYWCDSVRVVGNYLGKYASDQISRGGKLKFHVEEPFDNEETEWYEMDQEKFLHGLHVPYTGECYRYRERGQHRVQPEAA